MTAGPRIRLDGADVDPATPGVETVDGVASSPLLHEQRAGLCEDQLTQRGDAGPAGPTRAVEDDATDAPLERGDLLAQRGLCVTEVGRSPTEGPGAGDGLEGGEEAEVEHVPILAQTITIIKNYRFC